MRHAVDGLSFDADAHRYAIHGVPVPGVTSIIAAAGLAPGDWYTEQARVEGQYLHEAIALDHEGALDEDTLDPLLRPYLEGWRTLRREIGLVPLLWEFGVCDPVAGYAGTLDLVAIRDVTANGFVGHAYLGPEYWLIDLKRRKPSMGAALQTAAYRRALARGPMPTDARQAAVLTAIAGKTIRRGIVTWDARLHARLIPYDLRHAARDETRFLACLEVYKARQEAGYLS